LKKITKFLGRKNSMVQSCHFIKHNPVFNKTTKHQMYSLLSMILLIRIMI